jgi:predicted metal-binding membrane protein
MLILVAVGVMNILAMVVLTILIFAEKRLTCPLIARITGLCFFAATVAVVIWSSAFPGLRPCCVF